MTAPETLRTGRLVLRRARLDDAQAVFDAYASDPEVTRYMTWTAAKDGASGPGTSGTAAVS